VVLAVSEAQAIKKENKMSLRPKSKKRSTDPLPNFARQEAARKDVLRTQKIDFDPIHDIEQIDEKDLPCPDMPDDAFTTYPTTYTATEYVDPTSAFEAAEATVQELYKRHPEAKQTAELKRIAPLDPKAWIQTYTGKKFYPQNPTLDSICIEDIAHALSQQCRFTGHTDSHYSVAQHSVLVSYLCNEENQLYGLMHDGSEFALTDIASPIKRLPELSGYRALEKKVQAAICHRFGLSEEEPRDVKRADLIMLSIESQTFLSPLHPDWKMPILVPTLKIEPLSAREAERLFLNRFKELYTWIP